MMTPVCRTNDQWTAKFRFASDPTQYASQPYVLFVQRVELWAERLRFRSSSDFSSFGFSSSILAYAAIDEELDAGHVGTVVRSKEDCRPTQIVRCPESLQRHGGRNPRFLLDGEQPREARGVGVAGTENVDATARALQLDDPASCERADGSLRGVIHGHRRRAA